MKVVIKKMWLVACGLVVAASVMTTVIASVASVAFAQTEDSDDARIAAERAKHRKYPGGKDEQELTVQPSLPQTSRYPEAPKAAASPAPAGAEPESND